MLSDTYLSRFPKIRIRGRVFTADVEAALEFAQAHSVDPLDADFEVMDPGSRRYRTLAVCEVNNDEEDC